MFEKALLQKSAKLIIRPELREFWCDNLENRGRPLKTLRCCKRLQELNVWSVCLKQALSREQTEEWGNLWDIYWAEGEDVSEGGHEGVSEDEGEGVGEGEGGHEGVGVGGGEGEVE